MIPWKLRKLMVGIGTLVFGDKPKIHRIPLGPLRGKKIYLTFGISPKMYFGFDEPWVVEQARALIKPGDIVYDIGAHVGYTSLMFAQILAGTGAIHAFEIMPSTATFLKKTVEANNFSNIVVHEVGLADSPQLIRLPVGVTMMTSMFMPMEGEQLEECTVVTLDKYVSENKLPFPRLIKIDIEQAEIACLKGGGELIKSCKPKMIIEFHTLDLIKEGCSLLNSVGYSLFMPDRSKLNLATLSGLKHFHSNVLCLPNN